MATVQSERRTNHVDQVERQSLETVIRETEERRRSVIMEAASILMVPPNKVLTLLRNVWKVSKGQPEFTDEELFTGLSLIGRYHLDPIAKEVYVTRDKNGRLLNIVGIDGWIKILDRTDHYDGLEQVYHEEKGEVVWLETRIYSTKRTRPTVYRAFMREYRALSGFVAEKAPIHMLGIFSLRHAARRFVPLGGHVVTEDEAVFMGAPVGEEEVTAKETKDTPRQSRADVLADSLAEAVSKSNVTEAPGMLGVPKPADVFAAYERELAGCEEERHVMAAYDQYFGPDGPEWSAENAAMGVKARDYRLAAIKAVRRPAKRNTLLEAE